MEISVILPNYNHGKWLPRSLTALVRQDPKPLEIIVVDDGSTDNSVEIIERFQRTHRFIRLIRHQNNQGAEAAVGTALKVASGELLFFFASDDVVFPGLFAHAISALHTYSEAAFFCSEVVLIDKDDKIVGFRPISIPRSHPGYMSPSDVRAGLRNSDNWFIGPSIVYRRSRLAEIGFFDRSLGTLQDAIATRLLALRHGFFFAPEVLASWRILPDSLSARSSLSQIDNDRLLARATAWINAHFPEDVKMDYAQVFARRLRFNFARAKLAFGRSEEVVDSIADVLKFEGFDRTVMRAVSHLPMSSQFMLAWMTMRARPYGLKQLTSSLWRTFTVNQGRRAKLENAIEANAPEYTA